MSISNELSDISEVYWLLDRVLEDLGMVKQMLYNEYEPHERLFLSSLLALFGSINNGSEIDELLKELKSSQWKTLASTISFYLGVLAKNHIRKKQGTLSNINELVDMFNDINKKLRECYYEGNSRKIVDALFLEALILDLTVNILNLDVSKFYTNDEFLNKVANEYTTKVSEISFEYRIKMAYSALVFHSILGETINLNDLRKLVHGLLDSLDSISIEYRAFALRVFTALQMVKERQRVLMSLVNEYKSRFMYTTEKTLLRKLIARLTSGNGDKDVSIKYKESEETITLEITLTEEQIESIAKPNITQLCLLALGLMISGYHSSYTLPLYEQRNYIHFTDLIKEVGKDKAWDMLLLLDRLKLDEAFSSLLNEKFWPIFRDKLIFELILLGETVAALDYILSSIAIVGIVAHFIILIIIPAILYVLKTLAENIHTKMREIFYYLTSKKLRQALIESFRNEFYKKLGISG